MTTYLTLLRGVNVGGNRLLSMKEWARAMEQAGYENVRTYINSGNLLFSDVEDQETLHQNAIKKLILEHFDLEVELMVLSQERMQRNMAEAPDWWGGDLTAKHNAIFVIPPATPTDILRMTGPAKEEYERLLLAENMIFWSAPIQTFSRTRWIKMISTPAYGKVTIRNANTARKLLELMTQQSEGTG